MRLLWTSEALSDLARLHEFLAPRDAPAAAVANAARELASLPENLLDGYDRGAACPAFLPRHVRELAMDGFCILYEIRDAEIYILRLRHIQEGPP